MRITSIRIDSFGKIRNRAFDIIPGLNVFYGPNESGKSTTMEFVRCTLVPNKSNKNSYPERTKTDSGSILYSEDDQEKKIVMEGKTGHKGDVPACISEMDPALYRNIFAMDRAGLDDMGTLSDGDIRSRFLTIPGGESIPQVMDAIDKENDRLIGKTGQSPSSINQLQKQEDSVLAKINDLRSKTESYSDLSERKEVLENQLKEVRDSNKAAIEKNELHSKVESLKPAFDSLARYRSQRETILSKPLLQEGAEKAYVDLKSDVNRKKAAYEALDISRKDQVASLPGGDESKSMNYRPRMQSVIDRQPEYRTRSLQPVQKTTSRTPLIISAVLLLAAIAVWIIPGLDIKILIVVDLCLAVAIALILFKFKGRGASKPVDKDPWIVSYESEVSSISASLGIGPVSTEVDLKNISAILSKLQSLDSTRESWSRSRTEYLSADNKLLGFLTQYGGEKGYLVALDNTRALKNCESSISALESSIRHSGFDPNMPLPEVDKSSVDMSEQDRINDELGKVKQEMKYILDTQELDSLIDRSYILASEKGRILREGAVSLLASMIVQDACSDLYENVHPDVITTADRYLSMMTGGTCCIDTDPRNLDITVVSNGECKTSKQWSTGLRAQILLSLKLAIAKEMGNGDIPIILDDVLLPFDDERKKGAVKALSMLSEEMQVLLFTCDSDIVDACKELPEVSVITM